jgi:peptidoglycan/LPS O-acetylase OafA/YrhL
MEQRATPGHVLPLDGLRGVAAAVVVLVHSLGAVDGGFQFMERALATPFGALVNAKIAIQTFFVLSGFVLAGSLTRGSGRFALADYGVRRVFRIHVPYMAAVLFAWTASFGYRPIREGIYEIIRHTATIHLTPAQLLSSLRFPGTAYLQLPVGWTLEIEMIFSFLMPALLWLARVASWRTLVALSLIPLAVGDNGIPILKFSLDFALGIALYLERERLSRWLGRIGTSGALVWLAASLSLATLPMMLGWPWFFDGGAPKSVLLQSLGAGALVAGAKNVPALERLFSTRPCLYLGRISYSLYLLHFPLVLLLASHLPPAFGLWLVPLAFALSIAFSDASYRFVERPAIAAGKRLGAALARGLDARLVAAGSKSAS